MDAKETVTAFISEELLDGRALEDDENLLREGAVDSLGMLRLVAYIEESFAIEVPPEHFTIENFRSVNSINDYLARVIDRAD